MTTRDVFRHRAWAAALAGASLSTAAAAQPPILTESPVVAVAAPAVPALAAPVVPATAATLTLPPVAGLPPLVIPPPQAPPAPATPVVPPPVKPVAPPPVAFLPPPVVIVPPAVKPVAPPVAVVPPVVKPVAAPMVVVPPPVVVAAPPVMVAVPAPMVVVPPPVTVEVAQPIPPEPFRVEPVKPAAAPEAVPRVTGPATTVRPAKFDEAAVAEVRVGAKVVDAAAAYDAMLVDARVAYARVRDYSCHLIKTERVRGKLAPETTCELHARTRPAAVAVKAIAPATESGKEMIGIAGRYAGKFRMKQNGVFVTVDPTDARATSEVRTGPLGLGIGAVLDVLEKQQATEKRLRNPVVVSAGAYEFAGRAVTKYEVFTERPHALRYAYKVVVYADKETKLPVRFETYDAPAPGAADGELVASYSFVNLKLNPGLADGVFEK